ADGAGGRDRLGAAPGHPERRPWERRRAVWAQLRQAAGGGADTGSDPAGAVRLTAQSHRRRYRRPRRRHHLLRRLGNSPPRSPLASSPSPSPPAAEAQRIHTPVMATILIRASGGGVRSRASRGSPVVVMEPPENRD